MQTNLVNQLAERRIAEPRPGAGDESPLRPARVHSRQPNEEVEAALGVPIGSLVPGTHPALLHPRCWERDGKGAANRITAGRERRR
jgi:hypothetical protein